MRTIIAVSLIALIVAGCSGDGGVIKPENAKSPMAERAEKQDAAKK